MRALMLVLLCTSAITPGLAQHDFTLPPWMLDALGADRVMNTTFEGAQYPVGAWPLGRPHPLPFVGSYTYEVSLADSVGRAYRVSGWQDDRSAVLIVEVPGHDMRTTYLVDLESDVAAYAHSGNGRKVVTVERASHQIGARNEVHHKLTSNRPVELTPTGAYRTMLGRRVVELATPKRVTPEYPEGTTTYLWVDTTIVSPFADMERWLPLQGPAFMPITSLSLMTDHLLFRLEREGNMMELTELRVGPCPRPAVDLREYRLPRPYWEGGVVEEPAAQELITVPMEVAVEEDWVTFAEQMPQFPGGEEAFKAYVKAKLRYPEEERELGIEGTVYLSIIVEPNGAVTNITPLRGVNNGPGLTREAIRLLKAMPTWTPGRTNGKAMRVKMNVPVKFRLE
ncbi:MAG: energy transducer TonB [Flavobacteriales bacterium]|nr:energy transducer TonB [Flavobacteriales bacterium]